MLFQDNKNRVLHSTLQRKMDTAQKKEACIKKHNHFIAKVIKEATTPQRTIITHFHNTLHVSIDIVQH